jgi:hypothetical protein
VRNSRLLVALVASGAILALGVAGLAWTLAAGSSEAQQGTMHNCPSSGKWSIAVWEGDDGAGVDEALATCTEEVAAAYALDPDTGQWSRWFTGKLDVSNLSSVDNMEGVLALGGTTAPGTPSLSAGWTKIEPGGDTICATGTPYAFFVHPGTVNRLVVYFEGGGTCWNDITCSDPGPNFSATVSEAHNPANHPQGMFELDNPDNPFKDWFQVYVPSCTGDAHLGNATATYHWGGKEYTINYKGFVNASAVLNWIQAGFSEPEKLFVAGCSAGVSGSAYGAAYIHALYPDVPLYQLGDSGVNLMGDDFLQNIAQTWGVVQNLPDWIPALQVPVTELQVPKAYTALANYYASDRWAQYNTAHDDLQTMAYLLMGGTGQDWSQLMMTSIDEIQDATTNFEAYTAPGVIHCITPLDIFYTREVNGVKFVDWLDAMVNDQAWNSVKCTDCETDPEAGSPGWIWPEHP